MVFFQRNLYTPESSFTPLFRLLDDFDSYSRQGSGAQHASHRTVAHWQPKFDVRETGEAYELHGELPGLNKQDVHIEFTDPQTLHIRGKVERTYTAGTPPTDAIENASISGAITESTEQERPKSPHQATVEDEPEDGATTNTTTAAPENEVVKAAPTKQKPTDTAKYWLTERSVGEFSRTFNFPIRVNQDGVTASFKDGILNVVVPKAAKHEPRRIAVF
ncbi:30 kDa heat shock protein [Trichoderma asperellum]|uniref:30 kDa heat shock protein n=1 Tax=Trichoderma asperellum TaxID=101201 RepID=A0A6V8QIS9_TRIAP|nr:HSP20-like chaperone [Trichoderma asperelloides]GFP52384.1 30 kDa heat shock protein [Trichoderma asperellum]